MTVATLRLKRLFSSATGGSWGSEPSDGEVVLPCVRGTDLDNNSLRVRLDRAPLRGFSREDVARRSLSAGDIIIEKSGGGEQQPVGRVALYDFPSPAMPTNFAGRLRTAPSTDPRFVAYLLASLYFDGRTRAAIKQTTGIQNLDLTALLDERVAVPEKPVQTLVADFLDVETARIDALISTKQFMIELLVERRAAVTYFGVGGEHSAVAQCSVPWLDALPSHWRTAKLSLVAQLGSGHTPSRSRPEWWTDCTIPWVTTGEVADMRSDRREYVTTTRECISELGMSNSAAVLRPAGTVVLCRTASAGYSAIMASDMATSQDFVTWTCGPLLRPRFLLLCLRAMRRDLLGRLAMGSTHKTIYMPDIESIRVPLPPVDEQDQIVDAVWADLHRIDVIVDATTLHIELLQERRRALIAAAVTCQIEIPGVAA